MRDALLNLAEKADLAVASCRRVVDDEHLTQLIHGVSAVRARLSYPEELLVVALAGGTGSGKSSLLNAIAGDELVDVGGVRPTTSRPTAALPAGAGGSLDGYLDRLGVDERLAYEGTGFCLIDLPDLDSVETEHRHRVDVLLPLVDVVVWVTDPEKYQNARLHRGYLQPMAAYSRQFVFVMNQVDRLTPAQADGVCHDLATTLEANGLEDVEVIPVAAFPPSGPPMGIDQLLTALETKRTGRDGLYSKLLTDLETTTATLESEVGPVVEFDSRAQQAVVAAAESMSVGDSPGAARILAGLIDDLAAESGGLTSVHLEKISSTLADHVNRIEHDLAEHRPSNRRGWFRRDRTDATPADTDRAEALLSEAVIRPARAVLARRALAIASIAELALELESQRS